MWIGNGCQKCNNSGFKGRVGFFELVTINAQIRAAISENITSTELTATLPDSHVTMREDAISKAVNGVTTIGEILRAIQDTDGDY